MAPGNARLTPFRRALLVERCEPGWTITAAPSGVCHAAGRHLTSPTRPSRSTNAA
jgi:hypothetical protein